MKLAVDTEDGLPVAEFAPGEALPGGDLAWEELGVGHRCQTYLGWSERRCCPVVVKFPRPHQQQHPRARASLRRETAALQNNPHPALPQLYFDGTDLEIPYLISEYVDGPALDEEIDDVGAFAAADVALLGVQLLSALAAVHARELAHVDIKPDNVVLRNTRAVLLDFGSARPFGAEQPAGLLIGSPGYAAPELESGASISPAMDVFGVGLTLREALTGEIAFDPELAAARRPAARPLTPDDFGLNALLDNMIAPDPVIRPAVPEASAAFLAISRALGRSAGPDWLHPVAPTVSRTSVPAGPVAV